ncbi:MAG: hypothetical protein QXF12_00590 [Candidatus Aenigmatarchaeota archaeon]
MSIVSKNNIVKNRSKKSKKYDKNIAEETIKKAKDYFLLGVQMKIYDSDKVVFTKIFPENITFQKLDNDSANIETIKSNSISRMNDILQ